MNISSNQNIKQPNNDDLGLADYYQENTSDEDEDAGDEANVQQFKQRQGDLDSVSSNSAGNQQVNDSSDEDEYDIVYANQNDL